jgi:hypothetical protein
VLFGRRLGWRFEPEAMDIGNALLGRVSVVVDILTAEEASTMMPA